MKRSFARRGNLLFLTVRRKLAITAAAYLSGIYLAKTVVMPAAYTGILCALLLLSACVRLRKRRSALVCIACAAALAGNFYAGAEIARRDQPTAYGVEIEGRIIAIEKTDRVLVSDVVIDGVTRLERPALVTLMREEDEHDRESVLVGQHLSGKGRLFAQDQKRNPGGIERRIQTICDGYELSGYILPGWTISGKAAFSLREVFRQWREFFIARIENVFGENAPFFQGIMLGSKAALDGDVTASMRLTGTVHVLTVSGLHLTMLSMLLSHLMKRLPISRKANAWMMHLFLIVFTGLTGAAPGTIRACLMSMIRENAALRGKKYEPLTALAFAACAMTVVRPLWIFDASFQFSFLVVLGLVLLSRSFLDVARSAVFSSGFLHMLAQTVMISFCAQVAALPMQMMLYGYIPVLSLPMNVLCGILIPNLMAFGWLCTFAGMVCLPAARAAALPLTMLARGFQAVSVYAASVKGCIVRLPAPFEITVIMCIVLMILLSRMIRFGKARMPAAWMLALLIAVSYLPRLDPSPQYVQLDVGQGDAAVIRNGRRAVLYDVGPADSYEVIRYLRHEGLFADAVILSHLDEDHAGALASLLNSEIEIPAIIMADGAVDEVSAEEVIGALDKAIQLDIPIHQLQRGDRMSVNGIEMEVLSPVSGLTGSNDRSLLIHAQLAGVSILLTGDLPQNSEPVIVPRSDILKVAHHGSKYATSDAFVNMVRPKIALISVGAGNSYGHPAKRVISALESVGADVMRTDISGALTVRLEQEDLRASGFLCGR